MFRKGIVLGLAMLLADDAVGVQTFGCALIFTNEEALDFVRESTRRDKANPSR